MTSNSLSEIKRAEQVYVRSIKLQVQIHEKELSKLNFQNYNGSYYNFLKAQRLIQNKIDDLKRELANFYKLIQSDDKPKKTKNKVSFKKERNILDF